MKRFNPAEIEPKWQQTWQDDGRYEASNESDKPKYYVTGMFPYPSGAGMHVGHFMEHSIVDAVARFRRAHDYNVMYPMGWDAFGLPAENYAIKTGTSPIISTKQNIENFTNQLKRVGASIDWSREINTSDPEYYKWTQWIFTKLFERGLAYQKEANQWWCPVDMTVLANEQVEGGHCWRCGSEVIKKSMNQWFFKITDYADALLEETPALDWPEKIKTAQTNWIGRSAGAEIDFKVESDISKAILLHGFTGNVESNFFPWLSSELKSRSIDVWAENLPESDQPDAKDQAAFVLKGNEVNEDTAIIAHSYGAVTALRMIEQLEKPIKKLVLVAGFAEPGFLDHERNFEDTTDWQFDFNKIRANVKEVVILRPKNDSAVPSERADYLKTKLGGEIIDFEAVEDHACGDTEPQVLSALNESITVFSTRPDTIFGATFLVLAPEHPLAKKLATDDKRNEVEAYISDAIKKSEIERQSEGKEKTGVWTGSYAINPASGEKVPIWIADYVLGGYGTGAVMGVPAHDERDYEFALKFELPIIEVIDENNILINSGQFNGMDTNAAREKIVDRLEAEGVARNKVTYKMRDWLVSRQRYWGAPIPIIHCAEHGAVAVPENNLPVLLPEVADYEPKGDSVLATQTEWVNTTCPTCGGPAKRETDTMDGYACSSWYLLRYTDPKNTEAAWSVDAANYWSPIDTYVGGDHAVAHLLYVRFWSHVFFDMNLVPTKEPVKKLVYHGYINAEDGTKMSKSKGNVVDPLDVIDAGYGADALRTFELFLGPINENSNWSATGIAGVYRFLNRVWTLVQEYVDADTSEDIKNQALLALQHQTVKKVTGDINRLSFNTAIAALMECVNGLYKLKNDGFTKQWQETLETLVQLLAPLAPHMSAELWQQLGHDEQLDFVPWPTWDDALIVTDTITIVVQINGKVRAKLEVASDSTKEDVEALALSNEKVVSHLGGAEPKKLVYVPSRLVSIVI